MTDLAIPVDTAAEAAQARALFEEMWIQLAPPIPLAIGDWAESHCTLTSEESAIPGRYRLDTTPALRGVLAAVDDPAIRKVVNQKSAQIGYTRGVECNVIGYYADHRPSVIVGLFPREKSAKDFAAEKFEPMVRNTEGLRDKINLTSRVRGQGTTRRAFPGGLLKLVGSNSPADVKSTSARVVVVCEPDDASKDVRGQGDAIKLAEERAKTYNDHKIIIGGTPTAKNASSVEAEMRLSDQRRFWIECPHCELDFVPMWDQVKIPTAPEGTAPRDVYGTHLWEHATLHCPHCEAAISDDQRILAIRRASAVAPHYGWRAEAESLVAGFYHNELLSIFDGSRVPVLARKYLEAQHEMEQGKPDDMIVFWNSTLGLPWEYKGELPEEDELAARALTYPEWTCPNPAGLVPLLGVDVQHDRLAITCWVIGQGEEAWLAYWGEVYGSTLVAHQGAWVELEALLGKIVRHATGAPMRIAGCAIDCSDGQTSDASYAFVRKHNRHDRPVCAVKGAPDDVGRVEIWTPPKPVDPNNTGTKAARYGVQVHQVGTAKAKDLILGWAQEGGRVRLEGTGHGRMHWYRDVRADFFEQLLSEIKIPDRNNPKKRRWKARTDRRNEGLDCTVYTLWLSRHLKLHLRKPAQWALDAARLTQPGLLDAVDPVETAAGALIGQLVAPRSATPEPAQEAAEATAPATPSPTDLLNSLQSGARFNDLVRARRLARHGR